MSHVRRLLFLVSVASVLGFATPSWAAAPRVDDRAGFFSPGTLTQANQIVQDIYEHTAPHKQVVVETTPGLAAGQSAEQAADAYFRENRVDGVLVYLVKSPHRLVVTVGRHTQERFTAKDEVRDAMLGHFKRNDYDGGLLAGLQVIQRDLLSAFPAVGAAGARQGRVESPYAQAPARRSGGGFGWLSLLVIAAIVFFAVRAFSRRGSGMLPPTTSAGGGYVPPGGGGYMGGGGGFMGGGGGGGFGRSIMGGLLGSIGGNWLYDRFRGHDGLGSGGGFGDARANDNTLDVPASDAGDVGSDSSGSWGDDDGSVGGDTGGDWGGDSGGGGGDSGGDW